MPVCIGKKDKHIYLLVSVYTRYICHFFLRFFQMQKNRQIIYREVMIFHYQEHFERIMFFEMFFKEY